MSTGPTGRPGHLFGEFSQCFVSQAIEPGIFGRDPQLCRPCRKFESRESLLETGVARLDSGGASRSMPFSSKAV